MLVRSLKHTQKERVALTPIVNPGTRPLVIEFLWGVYYGRRLTEQARVWGGYSRASCCVRTYNMGSCCVLEEGNHGDDEIQSEYHRVDGKDAAVGGFTPDAHSHGDGASR